VEACAERFERLRLNGFADIAHQFEVVMEIVNRIELGAKNFADPMQVMQVAAGEVAAGVATAAFVERAL
jgi:hypothetical protein